MTIRSDRTGFGPLFDAADRTAPVEKRTVSTVAPQALFLLNHPFVEDAGRRRSPTGSMAKADADADRLDLRPPRRVRPAADRRRSVTLGAEFVQAGEPRGVGGVVPRADRRRTSSWSIEVTQGDRSCFHTAGTPCSRFANGFGLLGLADLLADEARAPTRPTRSRVAAAALPAEGEAGHLPVHVRRAVARRPVRPEAAARRLTTASRCRSRSRSSSGRKTGNLLAVAVEVREARRSAASRSASCSRTSRSVRRRPLRRPLDGRRQHQPQRRLPADEHRRAGVLAAEPGVVAALRPGQREPEPARLRRRQPGAAGPGRAAVEQQLPAGRVPGDARLAT